MRSGGRTIPVMVLAASAMLPLLGAWLAGRGLENVFRFPPPSEIPTGYPSFSWWAMALVAAFVGLVVLSWLRSRDGSGPRSLPAADHASGEPRRLFPWWGWMALAWTLAWWGLAWTRFEWFAWAQRYTFTPLWLGGIVTTNALVWRQRGDCLMARAPVRWIGLFIASAAFWWGFEWLNRFVLNWHYFGHGAISATEYAIHASVCFATVLPAVAAGWEGLGTMPRLTRTLARGPRWSWLNSGAAAPTLVIAGAGGLLLSGARPLYFYPALWVAPLLIGLGLAITTGRRGWWTEVAIGDWRSAGRWALAALLCGFFWEMWNAHSLAHWIYTVPFVERWHLFEMPLAGYVGYLPFGLECGFVFALLWPDASTATAR